MGTAIPDIEYMLLPGALNGLYDKQTHTIYIDPRLDPPTTRATLVHELVHAERGDTACCDAWFHAKQELTVERAAAMRLISTDDLIAGVRETSDDRHLAAILEVDLDMLHTRIGILTEAERRVIEEEVTRLGRTA